MVENFFFFTVQLLRSKNDFSGGKVPEKINLGNNCRASTYTGQSIPSTANERQKKIPGFLVPQFVTYFSMQLLDSGSP